MKYFPDFPTGVLWKWKAFLLLAILHLAAISTIEASPFRERRICGQVQCKDSKKFHYKAGAVYSYSYAVNVTTSIEGGPGEVSGMHLSSAIAIKFLTPCEAVLSMRDVEVYESHLPSGSDRSLKEHRFTRPDSDHAFSEALQKFSLRFSYVDGVIEEICPDPEESVLMLNVKRGLLSSFQNTMRRLDLEHKGEEDDIHGRCAVEYRLGHATSSSLAIERSKDIGSCGDKFGIMSIVQGTPYHFGTLHQSMPAVSSTSECEHVVDRNLVARLECTEIHKLQSLARGSGAAQTHILQKLDLTSIYDPSRPSGESGDESLPSVARSLPTIFNHLLDTAQTDVFRRESLQFRHHFHLTPKPSDHATAKDALTNFCASLKEDVSKSAGDYFEALVTVLRGLSSSDMTRLSEEATDICQGDRTPFDDALEAVGTAASVHVIKERILKGDAFPSTIRSWIDSLTYIPKPELAVMEEAVDILRERGNYPEILLTFSTLAHSYCKTNSKCAETRPIDILSRLYKKFFVHTGCFARQERDVEQILMYLRGIGNFGYYSLGIKDAVSRCIQRSDRTEIRVAAIESYRRMGCTPEMDLMKIVFVNPDEDSEVRIAAFLSIMRCPSYDTIQFIKKQLEVEEVNQVGSFVVSYLRNLQETALPSKAELQGLVSDENFSKKFSTDFRKFSRSFEVSSFYDDFNFGLGVENNLIFSQKSYLPRSASLNVTVDLFGESINVFETSLRIENFEHYIESLFGPNGKFRNKELHSIVSSFREKRATPNKRRLRQLSQEFDAMRRYNSDPIASISFKTFGNEIFFKRSVGVGNNSKIVEAINPFEWFKNLAQQSSNFEKSKMFLDSAYIIPTGIGLPLNLTATASALLKFASESEFISESSEFKVKGKLKPSAMLAVTGSMVIGTADFQTGIKVKAHLRSSTAIDGTFHIRGTELIQAEFGLPQTQLELLDYKSEVLFVQGKAAHTVGKVPQKPLVCSGGLFQEFFGLKLCRSFHFHLSPNSEVDDLSSPYFPLNGPAFFKVVLEKANPSVMGTRIIYAAYSNETNSRLEATYGIKTAQHTKSFGLTYDMDRINQNLALGITFPGKEIRLSGAVGSDGSGGNLQFTALSNNVQVLASTISFVKTDEGEGKALLKPEILIKLHNSPILNANGELRLEERSGGLLFNGSGLLSLESSSPVNVRLHGASNESGLAVEVDAAYSHGVRSETFKWKSEIRREWSISGEDVEAEIDTSLSLRFSQFPDYNLEASWKFQNGEEAVTSKGELEVGSGQNTLNVRHQFAMEESYGGRDMTWLLLVTEPRRESQWGVDGSLKAVGNALNTTINLQYAPGKKIQASLAFEKGSAGALALFGTRVDLQIPDRHPLIVHFHLKETTPHTYEGKLGWDWFGSASLSLQMNFLDRTRRQKLDKELLLGMQFGTTRPDEVLKFRSHLYSDEKTSKLSLSSEHENRNYSWEGGQVLISKGSKRHQFYSSINAAGTSYLVTLESGIDDRGLEISIETQLNSKFPDIYAGLSVTKVSGVSNLEVDYKWDASRDGSKSFRMLALVDASQSNHAKYTLSLKDPTRDFKFSAEQNQQLDRSRSLSGKMSWSPTNEIVFNGQLKKIQGQQNSYDLSFESQTPIKDIKNISLKSKLNCANGHDCLISIDGSWGLKGRVSGVITSNYEVLEGLEVSPEQAESVEEEGDSDEEEDEGEFSRRRRRRAGWRRKAKGSGDISARRRLLAEPGYAFRFNSNLTTSVKGWEALGISMHHTQNDPFHLKTDFDMQLPGKKELSISNQWDLPRRLEEIWSARAHFQAKTPFPNYQTFDLQAIFGHKEDSDTLATFGIYTDNTQYSLTITGTPKFDREDGSLGFDLVTSLPNYDKIFGSLSYGLGESSRLACQLGWPRVLIGLETGFEWSGTWEEFQTFLTFNSPWEPLKNINTLAKIDTSQVEFKFLVNEEGITAKSEWVYETPDNFDLRVDATSPFPKWRRVGLIAKHSLEEWDEYYSQLSGWINEAEIGYIWKGGKSELEDEDAEGSVMNSQVEIYTIVYPTIRASTSLVRREAKYTVEGSLALREGPINLFLELNLLESFRFNEKIRITSPYPGLYELEINLNPAFIPERDLYNLGFNTKWTTYAERLEAGVLIRTGDQSALAEALTQDLEDEAVEEDYKEPKQRSKVIVPLSQLFQLNSPWKWLKTVQIELERIPKDQKISTSTSGSEEDNDEDSSNEDDEEEGNEDDNNDQNGIKAKAEANFPWKTVVLLFQGDAAELNFNIQNEIRETTVSAGISLREIQSPVSLKFQSKLDMGNSEKKLHLEATSHWPTLQEILFESSFQKERDFLNIRVDLQTPFPAWEGQHAAVMYAINRDQATDTLDLELASEEFGKLASNIVRSPLSIGLVLNTPLEGYTSIEFDASSERLEDSAEQMYETVISTKIGEIETFHIEVESTMEANFPKKVNGTIRTTFEGYEQGNLGVLMRGTEDELNANGQIDWRNEKLSFSLRLKVPEKNFKELDLRVSTPFTGYEKWKVGLKRLEEDSGESTEYEEDEIENGNEEDEEEKESINFLLNAETPWSHFSPFKGKVKVAMISGEALPINGLTISGNSPNANLALSTSWTLKNWNRFQIQSHSNYSHSLKGPFFSGLPNTNSMVFKIRNIIPNFEFLEKVDSLMYYETQSPSLRYGSSAFAKYKDSSKSKSLALKLTCTLPSTIHNIDLASNIESDFRSLTSSMSLTSIPESTNMTSRLQIHRKGSSLEGDATVEWGSTSALQSKFNCIYSPASFWLERFQAQMFLPKGPTPSEVVGSIQGSFDTLRNRHKVHFEGKRLGSKEEPLLVDFDLSGHSDHLDSTLFIKSPFDDFPSSNFYAQGRLENGIHGKIGGTIGSQNASVLGHLIVSDRSDSRVKVNGTLEVELPFEQIESGRVECYALTDEDESNVLMKLILNNIKHIDSVYKYQSRSGPGSESAITKLQFANQIWPFGFTRSTYNAFPTGSSTPYPSTTVQLVEVYDLVHSDLHKLGGELRIERTFNGREITLTGLHPLRNVSLTTKYEFSDKEFRQNLTFSWARDAHMGYDLRLQDLSRERKLEQRMEVRVHYPVRLIRLSTGYMLDGPSGQVWTELDLNVSATEERGLKGTLQWDTEQSPAMTLRKVSAIIKHPLLPQDIRGEGELRVTKGQSIDGKMSLDYSGDPKRRLTFFVKTIQGPEEGYFWNLTTDMRLQHAVTNLDLKAFHSNRHLPHELSIITLIDFKNSGKLSRDSKITFELFKQLKKLQLMLANPDEHFAFTGQFTDREGMCYFVAETNITGYNPSPKAEMKVDKEQPYFRMTMVHGKDGSNGLYSEGGVVDSRNVKFDISESYDNFRFSDVNFFLRMNHSRLVTSKLIWRPELLDELQAAYVNRMEDLKAVWSHQSDKLVLALWTESTQVYNQVWENAKTTIEPFMEEMRQKSDFGKDSEALSQYFENALEQNDFYMEDIMGLAQIFADQVSLRFSNVFINLRQYREEIIGDTTMSELFENGLLWILEKAKDQYRAGVKIWETYKPRVSNMSSNISFEFPDFSDKFAYLLYQVVDVAIELSELVYDQFNSLMGSIGSLFQEMLERHRTAISAAVHKIEIVLYRLILGISDFIYETREEVVRSTYYQKLSQLAYDLDQLYQDLIENDMQMNTSKYYAMFINFLQKKTNFEEIKIYFETVCSQVEALWTRILEIDFVKEIRVGLNEFSATVQSLAEYTHFGELATNVAYTLYEKGPELMRQTVLEANAKYQQAKTKFIFDADKGIVDWEQKLPMPWSAFNKPPLLSELPEYQGIMKIKELFHSPPPPFLDVLYQPSKNDENNWFPPFDGHALVAGSEHFVTFDGRNYNFSGGSVYLLSGDLVGGNFTVSLDRKGMTDRDTKANIIVTSGHNTLIIDFGNKTLRDPKRPQNVGLPIQMHYLQGFRDGQNLVVQSTKGEFVVECNLIYSLCQLSISGWHSRKVGGLLGTMDHEPRTDLIHSNGKVGQDISDMARSWDVSDDNPTEATSTRHNTRTGMRQGPVNQSTDDETMATCHKLFVNRFSSLQPCFDYVDATLYFELCLNANEVAGSHRGCFAAMTYSKICQIHGVEVQMPSVCIRCDLNGEAMMDRDVKVMDAADSAPRSADIVFLVEAKDCNKQIYVKRRLETLVSQMELELGRNKVAGNRYAVVGFGGDGVFSPPRSILFRGQLFTDAGKLGDHFKILHTSNTGTGSRDTFGAIMHSLNLGFRPGVAKILILLPCTSCQPRDMTVEFATVQYAMLEQGASLHVLLHKDLEFSNKKIAKKFFGMDNEAVFTKLDAEKVGPLRGNRVLRGEIKVSKKALGYCAPLALQSNGTIFNGKKLQNKRDKIANGFVRVFSRRVASAAEPLTCHSCYCSATKYGTGSLKCIRCDYQPPKLYNPEMDFENELEGADSDRSAYESTTQSRPEVQFEDEDEDMEEDGEDPIEDDYEDYPDADGPGI